MRRLRRRKHVKITQQAQASGSRIVCATRGMKARFFLTGRIGISRRPITSLPSIQWVQVMLYYRFHLPFSGPTTGNKREAITKNLQKQQLSRHKFALKGAFGYGTHY